MRVLIITDYATPTGGAELMMLRLRAALRDRGHDARLFASSARPLGIESEADYECFGIDSQIRGLSQVANPSAYLNLQRVLAQFRPDVVHVRIFLSQISPLILPLLRRVPAILHEAWYRSICPIGTKMLPDLRSCSEPAGSACLRNHCFPVYAWPTAMLQLEMFRRWRDAFDLVVANSHTTKRRLEAAGMGVSEVIWNGVPQRPARPALGGVPTIAFAARLVHEKGGAVLIDAFAKVLERIPNAVLLIAGDGPERLRLLSQIERLRLGSRVRMLGHLPRTELEERFAPAWVQVVPSLWEEPFGIVTAESLMRGTAVVASNAGGPAEIVRHNETGLLVPPNDAPALALALTTLLGHPEAAEAMGQSGREFALQYLTEEVFVDRFLHLYRGVIEGRP